MSPNTPSLRMDAEPVTHKTTTNTKKKRREEIADDPDRYYIPEKFGTVRTYTYEDVSKHNTPDDLWMVLHGNVYDVTPAIESHPGGAEVLLDCGGMDATIAFDEVGHSRDSVLMLDPLFLGIIDEDGCMDSSVNGQRVVHGYVPSDRSGSASPATWAYTTDIGDGDGAIKNSKTGKVENVSLGESQFLKKIRQRRRKKKWVKEEHLVVLLALLAMFAASAFIYLQKRKWE